MRIGDPTRGLNESELEGIALEGESLDAFRAFWERSARTDAVHAIADQADDESWLSSGRTDLEGLRHLLTPEARVLEIGCGIGRILQHLPDLCAEVHGVDISAEMVEQARARLGSYPNVHVHQGNGYDLGMFEDSTFDLVFSAFVFQHMPKTTAFNYLVETNRVLRPGGRLRLVVPNLLLPQHFHSFHHFTQPHFLEHPYPMNFYTPQEAAKLLMMAGFRIDSMTPYMAIVATRVAQPGMARSVRWRVGAPIYELTGGLPWWQLPRRVWRRLRRGILATS